MKFRSLLFAVTMFAATAPAMAQEAATAPVPASAAGRVLPDQPVGRQQIELNAPSKLGPGLLEEQGYLWFSRHFTRPYPDGDGDGQPDFDTNRLNLYMPWDPGFVELRGYGQIFAPGMIYDMFKDLPNDTTGLIYNAAYYEQFQNAREFTIDTVVAYWFKNTRAGTPLAGAKFYVFRSPNGVTDRTYFNATTTGSYRNVGMNFHRDQLPVMFEEEITPEEIDATIDGNSINPLLYAFDPPLAFEAGQFAIPMIINDEGEALTNIQGNSDTEIRDYQNMVSFFDFRSGERQGFGVTGTGQNARQNFWKSLGVALFRPQGEFSLDKDSVQSLWAQLSFANGTVPATITNLMSITGTVEISAGIKYHFGRQASSAGLGSPTPNPVVATSRLPFSLTELADVTVDLFDANGTHVRQLAKSRYVPGNYSIALPVDELSNGTYVARMVAGSNVYTMKINVAK